MLFSENERAEKSNLEQTDENGVQTMAVLREKGQTMVLTGEYSNTLASVWVWV